MRAAVAPAGSAGHVGDRRPRVDYDRELLCWCPQMERGIEIPAAVLQPSAQPSEHGASIQACMLKSITATQQAPVAVTRFDHAAAGHRRKDEAAICKTSCEEMAARRWAEHTHSP